MAGTRQRPWPGHRDNWDDGQDPTNQTQATASLLLWRLSPVLQKKKKEKEKVFFSTLIFAVCNNEMSFFS